MGAVLDDPAVIDHEDLIRVFHGFESVSDHDDGLLRGKRLDSTYQFVFIFRIDIGRRLVQEDHRRVLHHSAGDGNPLLLSAGQ